MGAKEIMSKKFEMVLRGYKTEEVEEFLREVSLDFSRLQKENEDLEKKLEVLADKIREYREDEDTLKDAIMGAQRQGNALIADAKRKSAAIIEEAQENASGIIQKAEDEKKAINEKGAKDKLAAEEKAKKIIDKANNKAIEIEDEMNLKTDVQKEILHRTTMEIEEFKQRILNSYKSHMDSIGKIAKECENEFISETNADYKKSGGSKQLSNRKNKINAAREVRDTAADLADILKESGDDYEEPVSNDATSEINDEDSALKINEDTIKFAIDMNDNYNDETIDMNSLFGKDDSDSDSEAAEDSENFDDSDVKEVPLFKENKEKQDLKKTSEIFFNKKKGGNSRSKQLKFGGNSEDNQ